MYYPSDLLAKALVDDRLREANQRRRAHQAQRSQKPSPAAPRFRTTTHRARFWSLVNVRHAHG